MKPLPGSHKDPARDARPAGDVDPEHVVSVTVILRPKEALDLDAQGKRLTREQFARLHGADRADIARVEEWAASHHLSVAGINLGARAIVLRGRAADLQQAFGVELKLFETAKSEQFRGRTGPVMIPEELEGIVESVFGLDDRPVAKPHLRRVAEPKLLVRRQVAGRVQQSLSVQEVATMYRFPKKLDGRGQCIAIIELGGGYRRSDIDAYCKSLGVATPSITAVGVGESRNHPGRDEVSDGEVTLDIEVALAVAPKAKIVVYFTSNTNAGFLNAVNAAIHDDVRNPSIISISWGGAESTWTDASRRGFDEAFQAAAAMGVTVLAAAGDDGSSDGVDDGKPHVDFPASSPHVLACGGTRLTAKAETVWNNGPRGEGAGGGGVSDYFARPSYQTKVRVPKSPKGIDGRGLPDVCGNADPMTGYKVIFEGKPVVIGGTSAVAPLLAGLVALLNQSRRTKRLPTLGFINPALYRRRNICREITRKNNDYTGKLGVYKAGRGWNPCAGLGSVLANKWLSWFSRKPT